jgi:hypothetical protein
MSWKVVSTACCTEDILIANVSCGWSSGLEVEFYV